MKRGALNHGDPARCVAAVLAGIAMALAVSTASAQPNCNPGIEFFPEGPFKQCNLNGNHQVYTVRGDVVVCADGHPLVQFPDGRLQSCMLAATPVVAGVRCEAPARLELAADGSVLSCRKS